MFIMLPLFVSHASTYILSTATLQYTQRGPGQRSGPPKLARDPWETVKFESCGGAKKLGREPERLYPGPDSPSTNKANLH